MVISRCLIRGDTERNPVANDHFTVVSLSVTDRSILSVRNALDVAWVTVAWVMQMADALYNLLKSIVSRPEEDWLTGQ